MPRKTLKSYTELVRATSRGRIRVYQYKRLNCVLCNGNYESKAALRRHIKHVHLKLKDFECADCGHRFGVKQHLDNHRRKIHRADDGEAGGQDLVDDGTAYQPQMSKQGLKDLIEIVSDGVASARTNSSSSNERMHHLPQLPPMLPFNSGFMEQQPALVHPPFHELMRDKPSTSTFHYMPPPVPHPFSEWHPMQSEPIVINDVDPVGEPTDVLQLSPIAGPSSEAVLGPSSEPVPGSTSGPLARPFSVPMGLPIDQPIDLTAPSILPTTTIHADFLRQPSLKELIEETDTAYFSRFLAMMENSIDV